MTQDGHHWKVMSRKLHECICVRDDLPKDDVRQDQKDRENLFFHHVITCDSCACWSYSQDTDVNQRWMLRLYNRHNLWLSLGFLSSLFVVWVLENSLASLLARLDMSKPLAIFIHKQNAVRLCTLSCWPHMRPVLTCAAACRLETNRYGTAGSIVCFKKKKRCLYRTFYCGSTTVLLI